MNRQQANTLLDILAAMQIGDNTVEQTLQTAMKDFHQGVLANRGDKTLAKLRNEFDKKVDLLRWKLVSAYRECHKKEVEDITVRHQANAQKKEIEFSIADVAEKLKMTSQNLNQHLRNNKDVIVRTESPRKRYITESELNKLKQRLGITV